MADMHSAPNAVRVLPGTRWTTDGNFARIVTVISIDPELNVAVCRDDEDDTLHVEMVEHIALRWTTRTGAYDARRAVHQQAIRGGRCDIDHMRREAKRLAAIAAIVSEGEAP